MTTDLEVIIKEPTQTAQWCVIWLHGLGADGHDFIDIIPQLQLPEALLIRFVFPHAPIQPITINGGMSMRAWYDILSLTDIDREDQAGVIASQQNIECLIEDQISQGIPAERIILAGFSQGGAMALYTGLHYSSPLAGIIALSCYLPLLHNAPTKRSDFPILQTHGEQDEVVPITLGLMTHQYLKRQQFNIEWHCYPMAHAVCAEEISDISHWLQRVTSR